MLSHSTANLCDWIHERSFCLLCSLVALMDSESVYFSGSICWSEKHQNSDDSVVWSDWMLFDIVYRECVVVHIINNSGIVYNMDYDRSGGWEFNENGKYPATDFDV